MAGLCGAGGQRQSARPATAIFNPGRVRLPQGNCRWTIHPESGFRQQLHDCSFRPATTVQSSSSQNSARLLYIIGAEFRRRIQHVRFSFSNSHGTGAGCSSQLPEDLFSSSWQIPAAAGCVSGELSGVCRIPQPARGRRPRERRDWFFRVWQENAAGRTADFCTEGVFPQRGNSTWNLLRKSRIARPMDSGLTQLPAIWMIPPRCSLNRRLSRTGRGWPH